MARSEHGQQGQQEFVGKAGVVGEMNREGRETYIHIERKTAEAEMNRDTEKQRER